MNEVYLSIGSNEKNKKQNILSATKLLSEQCGNIVKQSAIYETPAWGFESNNSFLNIAVKIHTKLSATNLLNLILSIEKQIGRVRKKTNQPYSDRIIDIDIIFFNDEIINTENLVVPHPLMHKRLFVLKPICDINCNYKHPVLQHTITELIEFCEDDSEIVKVS